MYVLILLRLISFIFTLLKNILPLSGSYNLGIRSSNVVLPLPDFPTIATVSPLLTSMLMFLEY